MRIYLPLLGVLLALLVGLIVGKAWERYKLRDGRWIDRRRLRETPHYMLGLNFLVENQVDLAIEELTQAASIEGGALEIEMMLGNLYREKGQVGRAITVHQMLLQRPKLTRLEHAYVLLCLGLDFRHGGFVDRAVEAFQEVLRLDPQNRYALTNLQKLHEEQHQWEDAFRIRREIAAIGDGAGPEDQAILAFLRNEIGTQQMKSGETAAAAASFEAALELDEQTAPAYLNLGDMRLRSGDTAGAVPIWERLLQVAPERAYLALERLEHAYATLGAPHRFGELCRRLIEANPQDWRARLALGKHLSAAGDPASGFELLLDALTHNPHGLTVHQAIRQVLSRLRFDPALIGRYVTMTREAVFYLDPHVCLRCRYRSTELLWQCPQCHEWNTFVEERIAPKDAGELGT